jgi:hypothetical protein
VTCRAIECARAGYAHGFSAPFSAVDLRHHHDVGQLVPSPSAVPSHDPIAEPRANCDRRAKAEELRFDLHAVDHLRINTSIARWRDTVKSRISLSTL